MNQYCYRVFEVENTISLDQCYTIIKYIFTALENDLVREMIMKADLEALESVVLDGHGGSLLDEPAASNKVRAFIRSVPNYLVCLKKNSLLTY